MLLVPPFCAFCGRAPGLAELIDNSYEHGSSAIRIERKPLPSAIGADERRGNWMLLVKDNGNGMGHRSMVRMFSFGREPSGQLGIGKFGRGFKTGAMACARDAIVFTVSKDPGESGGTAAEQTCSVGLLSRTLNAGLEEVVIPIVTWSR